MQIISSGSAGIYADIYGVKATQVNVAVADPANPDNYIFGIMVDSKKHLDNSTARDRAISQPGVLKGLGWNMANVYTLDWLDNSDKVIEKLKSDITAVIENKNSGKEEETDEPKRQKLLCLKRKR